DCQSSRLGRANEGNRTPVGRPGGIRIRSRIVGQLQRRPGANSLYVNIEIVLLLAIPGKRDLATVWRKGRPVLTPKEAGQGSGLKPYVQRRLAPEQKP